MKVSAQFNYLSFIKFTLLSFLVFIILFPFIGLSFFNHPSCDDFSYAKMVSEHGFLGAQIEWYNSWTAKFFSTAMMSAISLIGLTVSAKIVPVIVVILLFVSIYIFVRELTDKYLSSRKCFVVSAGIFILYFYQIPSLLEGVYWMTGSIAYQLANILALLLFTMMLRFYRTEKLISRIWIFVTSCLLTVMIIGSNETSMFLLVLVLLSVFGVNYFILSNKKGNQYLLILLLISCFVSFLVMVAPGNVVRLNNFPDRHRLVFSIVSSAKYAFYWVDHMMPMLLYFTIFIIPVFSEVSNNIQHHLDKNNKTINPLITIILFGLIYILGFFPAFWSMGVRPPRRTVNVIYMFFIIGWFVNLLICVHYFKNRFSLEIKQLPNYAQLIMIILIVYLLIQPNIFSLVYHELFSGVAYRYNKEMNVRYEVLKKCKMNVCEIESIKNRPASLYTLMANGRDDEMNYYYAFFFHLNKVKLKSSN